jgi:hypothetical protein
MESQPLSPLMAPTYGNCQRKKAPSDLHAILSTSKLYRSTISVDRSGLKLSLRIISIDSGRLGSPMFAFPKEERGTRQNDYTDRTDGVEDVCHAYPSNPGRHREDEDRAHGVARESQSCEGVTDDICGRCYLVAIAPGTVRVTHRCKHQACKSVLRLGSEQHRSC